MLQGQGSGVTTGPSPAQPPGMGCVSLPGTESVGAWTPLWKELPGFSWGLALEMG